jgi:hypothetical protein
MTAAEQILEETEASSMLQADRDPAAIMDASEIRDVAPAGVSKPSFRLSHHPR